MCRIKLYDGNTVGRWNWKRNQYLAVFNFIWLGAQYRPTMPHRHGISLYVLDVKNRMMKLMYCVCNALVSEVVMPLLQFYYNHIKGGLQEY